VLDKTWSLAGEQRVFDAGWSSDHLSFAGQERGGPSFESLTTLAALAHHVPGNWLGVVVASNTFRHPSVLAKAATVLDNATGGRFILGMGAGCRLRRVAVRAACRVRRPQTPRVSNGSSGGCTDRYVVQPNVGGLREPN
jgi:alkanesulfonate monooxygenase SsuD/methylene tetrahydromethanopterin reductase-like flavin-dependent oxidoreductase (luciferase family)